MEQMHCRLAVNLNTDLPYWVGVTSFLSYFDQDDFHCRAVGDVVDAYLESWFYTDPDGTYYFLLPPVCVFKGVTEFISGRHRTAVLMKHLRRLPISFDSRDLSQNDREWIESVSDHPIDLDVEVQLPNLPIKEILPER